MARKVALAPPVNENAPIHTIRHRSIKASIWKNQTTKGSMYDVRVTRSYKVDDVWHDTSSFGFDDLLIVAKMMYDAHSFISACRAKEPDERRRSPASK
jgi:hypothetical protein